MGEKTDFSVDHIINMLDLMPGNNIVYSIENHELQLIYYTDSVVELLGYTQREYQERKDFFEFILEEDKMLILEKSDKKEILFRLMHKEKGFIWVHMNINKVSEDLKKTVFIGSLIDVTKEMLNSYVLMEATDIAICVIEKDTKRFLYANTSFYNLIDSTPAQAMGKHCYELLCKSMEMRTNDNCLCYTSLNRTDPIETYNPDKKMHMSMIGREIMWGEHESYVFYLTDITKERQKDEMLQDSIKRFNMALDNSNLMVWEYDMVNNRCINSEKAGRDYNVPLVIENYPESLFETGYTPPETVEQIKNVKRRLENGETGFSVERRTLDKYGNSNWQKVDYSLECDANGKPIRAIVCGLDITAQKELEEKYEEQMEYRNNLARKAMFSIRLNLDEDEIVDYTCDNPTLLEMMNEISSAGEFLDIFFQTSIFNPDSQISKEELQLEAIKKKYLLGQAQYQTMYQCSMLNKYLEMNLTVSRRPGNHQLEAFLIILDVTDNAFLHDTLTGLYNRQKSYIECRRLMDENPDEIFAMMHFDIQRFRLYNSFFGEKEGDYLLQDIADMFRKIAKTFELCVYGKLESDVFLLCFPYDQNKVLAVEDYIRDRLLRYREDFQLFGNYGMYLAKNKELSIESMFNRATVAAKSNRNKQMQSVTVFDEQMEDAIIQEQEILRDMKKAVEEEQFQVYLQPKYKLLTGEAFGAEALVRWIHPQKGIVSPGAFIPVFETNGFITTLDRYMWEHVCQIIRKWLDAGKNPAPVSVNVSRVSMYSMQTVPFLIELVEKYDIEPRLLNLELTESAYMSDPEEMKKRLMELRDYGFEIMMDDFGSGYSSLNTLRDIPVDYLKVDRMFLASVDKDERSQIVLSSVVQMATKMGIPVITEGVETQEQKEFVKSIGCDYVQGFLYSKPMPLREYEERIVFKDEK